MSAIGADPGQLDALARQLDHLAGLLDGRRVWLTGWIEADRFWRGGRANEFRHEWSHRFSPQISHAVGFLHEAVRELHDNANQQRVASGEQPHDYGAGGFLGKLFGDVVHGVEGAAAQARQLLHDATEALDVPMLVTGAGALLAQLGLSRDLGSTFKGWKSLGFDPQWRIGRGILGPASKALGWAGVGYDGMKIVDDVGQGKNPTGDVISGVIDVAATKNIYVAAGKTSYDVTTWFLTDTKPGREFVDANSSSVVNVGAHQVHGDPYTDPRAAEQLAHRYDGMSGFGNYVHDEFFSIF